MERGGGGGRQSVESKIRRDVPREQSQHDFSSSNGSGPNAPPWSCHAPSPSTRRGYAYNRHGDMYHERRLFIAPPIVADAPANTATDKRHPRRPTHSLSLVGLRLPSIQVPSPRRRRTNPPPRTCWKNCVMNSEASCCIITSRACPSQSRSERTRPTGLKWAFSDSWFTSTEYIVWHRAVSVVPPGVGVLARLLSS